MRGFPFLLHLQMFDEDVGAGNVEPEYEKN